MDWIGLTVNIIAIFCGLSLYIAITKSKWGREHAQYQYAIMLVTLLLSCLFCGVLRAILL